MWALISVHKFQPKKKTTNKQPIKRERERKKCLKFIRVKTIGEKCKLNTHTSMWVSCAFVFFKNMKEFKVYLVSLFDMIKKPNISINL